MFARGQLWVVVRGEERSLGQHHLLLSEMVDGCFVAGWLPVGRENLWSGMVLGQAVLLRCRQADSLVQRPEWHLPEPRIRPGCDKRVSGASRVRARGASGGGHGTRCPSPGQLLSLLMGEFVLREPGRAECRRQHAR